MEAKRSEPSLTPPTSTRSPATMSNSPRPRYFISREDGTITPLIAVDELPPSLHIVGVPAKISPAKTCNMISLGVEKHSQACYATLMNDAPCSSTSGIRPLGTAATEADTNVSSEKSLKNRSSEKHSESLHNDVFDNGKQAKVEGIESWRHGVNGIDKTQATIDAVVASLPSSNQPPSTLEAAHEVGKSNQESVAAKGAAADAKSKKEYCTYWIRTGECDYTQQGCRFKHEMPNEEILHNIGIRGTPRWYLGTLTTGPQNSGWYEREEARSQAWRSDPLLAQPPPATENHGIARADGTRPYAAAEAQGISRVEPPSPGGYIRLTSSPPRHEASRFPYGQINGASDRRPAPQPVGSPFTQPDYSQPTLFASAATHMVTSVAHTNPSTIATKARPLRLTSSPVYTTNPVPQPKHLSPIDANYRPLVPSPLHSKGPTHSSQYPVASGSYTPAPKSPLPQHRRLFIPPGESRYVANGDSASVVRDKETSSWMDNKTGKKKNESFGRRDSSGGKGVKVKGKGKPGAKILDEGSSDLLVDLEG